MYDVNLAPNFPCPRCGEAREAQNADCASCNWSHQDAKQGSPTGDDGQSSRWSWKFGIVELLGVSFSFAVLFALFSLATEEMYQDDFHRRAAPALLATAVAMGGTFLSSRLATQLKIQGNVRRLALQLLFTVLLVPPLLCVAVVTLPLLSLYAAFWARYRDDARRR